MHTHAIRPAALVLGAVLSFAVPLHAQGATYDQPSVVQGAAGHGKHGIVVTAGASGAPAGFTVRWMTKADFDRIGGVWPEEQVPEERRVSFTGDPSLNTQDAPRTFRLAPNQTATVEIGDLIDETGVSGSSAEELQYGTWYVFGIFANGDANGGASPQSRTLWGLTTLGTTNCTYTQGYWKNHESAWPVLSLTLGTRTYTQAELLAILDEPAKGNGLIFLAHQLIAAKLNIANGADPSAAAQAIADADALIGSLVVPPTNGSSDYIAPDDASSLTQILDDYNNGIIGPGHCGTSPVRSTSWGQIKSIYR